MPTAALIIMSTDEHGCFLHACGILKGLAQADPQTPRPQDPKTPLYLLQLQKKSKGFNDQYQKIVLLSL